MASLVSASVRRAAAKETLQFDWLLGDRNFFTFKAAAALIDMSDSFLEKIWEDAKHPLHLGGHVYNAGAGIRPTKRIARAFVVRLLVASANYDAEQKRDAVLSLAREFNAADCRMIAEAFLRAADRKP